MRYGENDNGLYIYIYAFTNCIYRKVCFRRVSFLEIPIYKKRYIIYLADMNYCKIFCFLKPFCFLT